MKKTEKFNIRTFLLACLVLPSYIFMNGQSPMPEVLTNSPIADQLVYIQNRTKIFDNYRAIREDMFQKLMGNISDTLTRSFGQIDLLNTTVSRLSAKADSLESDLAATRTSLQTAVDTKNSISIFGHEVRKHAYNAIMWTLILALALILFLTITAAKRNIDMARKSEQVVQDLKTEFEAYRKSSREAREKMSMDHFNELKKLRGTNR
jgi:hypothetical protein